MSAARHHVGLVKYRGRVAFSTPNPMPVNAPGGECELLLACRWVGSLSLVAGFCRACDHRDVSGVACVAGNGSREVSWGSGLGDRFVVVIVELVDVTDIWPSASSSAALASRYIVRPCSRPFGTDLPKQVAAIARR